MEKQKKVRIKLDRDGYQQQRAMIYFSNEKEVAIAIKETNKYKRWNAEEYKSISQNKMYPKNSNNTISKHTKNINHMRNIGKTTVK